MSAKNALASKPYEHPYDMNTARWIRNQFIFQEDEKKRKKFLEDLSISFGAKSAEILRYIAQDYRVFIRDDQMCPDFEDTSWTGAIWSCGRGFGKTFSGAPATIEYAMQYHGCRIGLLAPTFGMGKTNMVEGSSGIIGLSPDGFKPKYNKSEGSLTWPNGSTAKIFSAENGERVRGENFHFIWADEFCFFKFTGDDKDLWKMGKMALRSGNDPKYIITTSPRPIKALKDLYIAAQKRGSNLRFTTGTTFDNYSLPQSFIDEVKLGEGTSLYNQEILGIILDENPNALFTTENIIRIDLESGCKDDGDYNNKLTTLVNSMDRIVIGVDPNVVENIDSDETGVVVAGRKGDRGYIFKDASRRGKISEIWQMVVDLYHTYQADAIVVETNNGGDYIPTAIYNIDAMVKVEKVFASRGKRARAEPIGILYERKKVSHVGIHRDLESQMCEYNPQVHQKSPDYLKSVWRIKKLIHCKNFLIAGISNMNKRQYLLAIVNELLHCLYMFNGQSAARGLK